ncbi:MAG: protein kinase [Hydrogenoanaerobacterium sp.]
MTKSEKQRLCMGWMSVLDEEGKGPRCGYFKNSKSSSREYLPLRSELMGRYLIGKLLSQNGESAVYLAYDLAEECKIYVSEYFPTTLARRNESDSSVFVKNGREAQFKSLLYDFIENAEILHGISAKHGGIVPVLDIFNENGTAYIVYRYIQGQTLAEYIQENGGELTWTQAKHMIMPFLKMISILNQKGIIHRGISPDTLLVDIKGRLWLFGFGCSAVRTGESELDAELFDGYSAPEQYAANGWQGTWTDVYGISAVLYRMLTGTLPVSAELRKEKDSLYPPNMLNRAIPQNVSDAIDNGMIIQVEKRTPSVDKLVVGLLEAADSNTAVFSTGDNALHGQEAQRPAFLNIPFWLKVMLITVVLLSIVMISVYFGVIRPQTMRDAAASSQAAASSLAEERKIEEERLAAEAEKAKGTPIPNFAGQFAKRVQENTGYSDKYIFSIEQDYNEDGVAPGVIYDQLPSAGTPIPDGKRSVVLYVSKGSRIVPMPYLIGSTIELAGRTMSDLKIFTDVRYEESETVEPGLVIRASVEPYADVTKEKDMVYIYVSKKASASKKESSPDEIWIGP